MYNVSIETKQNKGFISNAKLYRDLGSSVI